MIKHVLNVSFSFQDLLRKICWHEWPFQAPFYCLVTLGRGCWSSWWRCWSSRSSLKFSNEFINKISNHVLGGNKYEFTVSRRAVACVPTSKSRTPAKMANANWKIFIWLYLLIAYFVFRNKLNGLCLVLLKVRSELIQLLTIFKIFIILSMILNILSIYFDKLVLITNNICVVIVVSKFQMKSWMGNISVDFFNLIH